MFIMKKFDIYCQSWLIKVTILLTNVSKAELYPIHVAYLRNQVIIGFIQGKNSVSSMIMKTYFQKIVEENLIQSLSKTCFTGNPYPHYQNFQENWTISQGKRDICNTFILISEKKHMLWVLIGSVSLRRFQ